MCTCSRIEVSKQNIPNKQNMKVLTCMFLLTTFCFFIFTFWQYSYRYYDILFWDQHIAISNFILGVRTNNIKLVTSSYRHPVVNPENMEHFEMFRNDIGSADLGQPTLHRVLDWSTNYFEVHIGSHQWARVLFVEKDGETFVSSYEHTHNNLRIAGKRWNPKEKNPSLKFFKKMQNKDSASKEIYQQFIEKLDKNEKQ